MNKKLRLFILAIGSCAATLHAQQRLSLYEGFTATSCVPCATEDAILYAMVKKNVSKIEILEYHIAGTLFLHNTAPPTDRGTYYGASFAPNGGRNGDIDPLPVATRVRLQQSQIDADSAEGTPFAMSVMHTWNNAGDSVTATVNIRALSAYAPAGADLKLRIAIVEHLVYLAPPGGNLQTDFHNVVRQLLPDGAGTQLPNAWSTNQSQTITIKTGLHRTVDKSNETYLVAWIQNDADKHIPQAARSVFTPLPTDATCYFFYPPSTPLACGDSMASVAPAFILKNAGQNTLTSARISYSGDSGPVQIFNWTGSLAGGDTTTVRLAPASFPALYSNGSLKPGAYLNASVSLPNGITDINSLNDIRQAALAIHHTGQVNLPVTEGFESSGSIAMWTRLDSLNPFYPYEWSVALNANKNIGRNGSKGMMKYTAGANVSYVYNEIMPDDYLIIRAARLPAGPKALDFYLACSPSTNAMYKDRLEVVYSTDCGASWTTVWGAEDLDLATTTPNKNTWFYDQYPADSEYAFKSIDMSRAPDGAMIAFRGFRRFGHPYFIDDVTLRTGNAVGIANVSGEHRLKLYPNPANDAVTLDLNLNQGGQIIVRIYDAIGRLAAAPVVKSISGGTGQLRLSTAQFRPGVYNVTVQSDEGIWMEKLSVVK